MNPRFIVTVESENLYGEIWVNNLPVGTFSPSESSPFSFPVNEYILEGANRIGIMLHAGPDPSTSQLPWGSHPLAHGYKGPATLALKFAKYLPDEVPFRETPPVLAAIEWHGEAVPVPAYQEKIVTIAKTFDAPPWVSAHVFKSLDAALRHEALDYVSYLYNLLASGKFDTYIELSRLRLGLMTKAYGVPLEPLLENMLGAMHEASKPPFKLEPFSPQTIDLRLVGDGRLVDVNRAGRGYVFLYKQTGTSDETFFFPIKIGKKDDKWMMLA